MVATPRVSVIMSVYNGERYLCASIDSILSQTFQDFEFLIINDGSTDGTRDLIVDYDDPRIRLVENEHNVGLTKSLNRGLALARGDFIARQDADDIAEPERLAKQVAFLEQHPTVALLGTWATVIDAQGQFIEQYESPCDYIPIRWALLFFNAFIHSSVMLRASALRQVGLYDENLRYAQDYDLWCRIARRMPVVNLGEYLVRYRVNPYSITATHGDAVGLQMRIANIARMLGWNGSDTAANATRFQRIDSLLFGPIPLFNRKEVSSAIADTLRLFQRFRQDYGLNRRDSQAHWGMLRALMCKRLIDIAYQQSMHSHYADAVTILGLAFQLHAGVFTWYWMYRSFNMLKRRWLFRSPRQSSRSGGTPSYQERQ